MLKPHVLAKLHYKSGFGEAVFKNVTVFLDEGMTAKAFNQERDDFALSGETVEILEREMAKQWLRSYVEHDPDGNHIRRWTLTRDEFKAIFDLFGVKAIAFANAIGVSKGQISKMLAGDRFANPSAVKLLTVLLQLELKSPGHFRGWIGGLESLDTEVPQFDMRKLSKQA